MRLIRPRTALSLERANHEVYVLLKNGVKVNVDLEKGGTELVVVRVVDWREKPTTR